MNENILKRYNLVPENIKIVTKNLGVAYIVYEVWCEDVHLSTFYGPDSVLAMNVYIDFIKKDL